MARRILPAIVVVGLLAAGTTSFASQLAQQPTERAVERRLHDAVAALRVLPKSAAGAGTTDYEKFRQAEMQLIASPEILRAALDRPGIAELDALGDVEDKVAWLARHVAVVAVPESEDVEIRLRGDDSREAALIIDAVATAYADKINKQEGAEWLKRADAARKKYEESKTELRKRIEALQDLARSLQSPDLSTLRTQLTQLQRDIVAIDTELQRIEATGPHEPADDSTRRSEAVETKSAELRMRRERLAQQAEETSKKYDRIAKEVVALSNTSAEFEAKRDEISELFAITNRLGLEAQCCHWPLDRAEIVKLASSTDSSEGATGGAERSDDHSR